MQVTLETARKRNEHIAGITLDLRKCFNLINRNKITRLMSLFGIHPEALHKWSQSLELLARVWVIDSHVSHPTSSSSGCPEGDPWSVIAMLVIAACWVFLLKRREPQLAAAAYADNWSRWLREGMSHADIIQGTIRFTSWLGLEIDWLKTWVWGTTASGTADIRARLQRLLPHQHVPSKWFADDLGCPLTYRGNTKQGVIHDRLLTAKKRLKHLKNGVCNLQVKAYMLATAIFATAIFPVALYGSEVTVIGQTHLDQLRSQAASAIIGDTCRSMNPAVCLHFADKHDLDPTFLVICKALKAAKMYLLSASPADRETYLSIAATPTKFTSLVQGPASALREYLAKVGWSISKTGDIQVTGPIFCNILTTPFKRLRRYLLWAWEEQLLMMCAERKKLFNMPPVDKVATLKILDSFSPTRKKLLLRETAGAFQATKQQSKWDEAIQEHCQSCGENEDTRCHRMFECKAFQELRAPHSSLVQHFLDAGAVVAEIPVRFKHPHYEFFDAVHANMTSPPIDEHIVSNIMGIPGPRHFFTDGSMKHPGHASTRYAAFSVAVDLCIDDHQRVEQAERYLVTKQWPITMQQVYVSRLAGEQCIHRAETEAVLKILESFPQAIIHTDSASTVSKIATVWNHGYTKKLAMHADSDHLSRIAQLCRETHEVRKIKAHRELGSIRDPLERYWAIGNAFADHLADVAVQNLFSPLVAQWEAQHSDELEAQEQYNELCTMILKLQIAREQSSQQEPADQQGAGLSSPDVLLKRIQQPWTPPAPWREDWLQYSVWGIHAMHSAQLWLQQLQWDMIPAEPTDIGISWTEIAFSLTSVHGMILPVKRQTDAGVWKIIQPQSFQEAISLGIDLQELTSSAVAIITQYRALVPEATVPSFCKPGKCASLYQQGFFQWTTGWTPRPAFPGQDTIIPLLKTHLHSNRAKLGPLPAIDVDQGFQLWTEDGADHRTWDERNKQLTSKLHAVRRARRLLD